MIRGGRDHHPTVTGTEKKIRFFNTYEPVTTLYRDLFPNLISRGATIEAVISRGEYRLNRDFPTFARQFERVQVTQTISLGLHAQNGFRQKAIVNLLYILDAGIRALLGRSVSTNVFLTQPPLFSYLGSLLRVLRSQPYWCILMDIQPDLAIATGSLRADGFTTRFMSWISRKTIQGAEGVIVIGRCMKEFVSDSGVERARIHCVHNWADERVIYPVSRRSNPVRDDLGWQSEFVFMYAGNIGLAQHFDDFLAVAEKLRNEEAIVFAVIGEGVVKKRLMQRARQRQLSNVVFFPFLHDRYSLAEIISAGDLHFVSLKPECTGLAVPSKTYAILAAGRPVLYQGAKKGEIARVIEEECVGRVVPIGDVDAFSSAVLDYASNNELRERQGRRARRVALERYGRDRAVQLYTGLFLDHRRENPVSAAM